MLTLLLSSLITLGGSPFAELDYEAALAQSKKEHKLLLVDFTASWCGPCKMMEKNTWSDEGVQAWLKANAIAIQVDVDKKPKVARQYEIENIPAVVALLDGAELDRSVGYRDAPRFLAWAKKLREGKPASDELLERAKNLKDSQDVQARYQLAKDMVEERQYDDALAQYLWLWPAMRQAPGLEGVRLSFLLDDMAKLAQRHAPAKEAFGKILDELQQRVEQAAVPAEQDWSEWSSFCRHFDERPRVIAWYEKHRNPAGRLFPQRTEPAAKRIVYDVFGVLMEADRPVDAVNLYVDARARADEILSYFESLASPAAGLDPQAREQLERTRRAHLTEDLSRLYGALLAADRQVEATDVARKLIAILDVPESRLALVRAGTDLAQRSDPAFARWLDEAEAAGANVKSLRRRLAKLQGAPGD